MRESHTTSGKVRLPVWVYGLGVVLSLSCGLITCNILAGPGFRAEEYVEQWITCTGVLLCLALPIIVAVTVLMRRRGTAHTQEHEH